MGLNKETIRAILASDLISWATFLLLLLIPQAVSADRSLPSGLITLLNNYRVVLLGERHKMPESASLLTNLVRQFTASSDKCLSVALEIGSDQQEAINRNGPVSKVFIHPIIDHPGYRKTLSDLRDFKKAGRCIKIMAIAVPENFRESRSSHMAEKIFQASRSGKVVALVGNTHAIKKITWKHATQSPSVAERLLARDVDSVSILQKWGARFGARQYKGSLVDMNEKLATFFLQSLAAFPPENPEDVADKVIIWD
jgi:hypothetical protein